MVDDVTLGRRMVEYIYIYAFSRRFYPQEHVNYRAVTEADFYHRGGHGPTTAGGTVLIYIYIYIYIHTEREF